MKKLITLIAAVPVLALFGGVGILALRIGETWTSAATESLVHGISVTCGSGALLFAVLLACIVGVPLAIRAYGESGANQRRWQDSPTRGRSRWREAEDGQALPDYLTKRPSAIIDGQWTRLPVSGAPWDRPDDTSARLLPPAEQDERFGFDG